MKQKIILAVLVTFTTISFSQSKVSSFFEKADSFFSQYVNGGKVAYNVLKTDNSKLEALIKLSNTLKVNKADENTFKAFWINVYNLGVIQQVVVNYPVKSPIKIIGFFDNNKMNIGGKYITLNDIENKILRSNFKDPRFHFVLVCGAVSCPPIVNYAYVPSKLDHQLDNQTRLALNNINFIKQEKNKVKISEIFSWYKQDFGSSKQNIVSFINKYRVHKIDNTVSYYSYDWTLNDQVNDSLPNPLEGDLSNIQTFTPSKLLSKGQFDVKWFNSVFTQTRQTLGESSKAIDIPRQSFYTSTLEFYYGVSKSSRVNLGFITQARSNTFGDANTLSVFKFKDNGGAEGTARSGLTTFAPSVRVQPFAFISNFSFTSSVYLPIFEKDKAGYLDKNSVFWETKFFYDYTFGGNKWQIFTEADLGFNFGEKGGNENFANNSLDIPLSAFLSYFPSSKSTIFINTQHRFFIGYDNNGEFSQNHTAIGLGGKYQATNQLNLELSVNKFVRGYNFQGLGQSFSLGLRYLSSN